MSTHFFRQAALASALVLPPSSSALASSPLGPSEDHGAVRWFEGSFSEALAQAKASNKLIFIDFWTDWCTWCKRLDKDTFSQEEVARELADVICLSVDAESEAGAPLAKRFAVQGYPALLLVNAEGQAQDSIGGYLPPQAFVTEIQRVKRKDGTVDGFEAAIAHDPDDLEARYELAQKLQLLGDAPASEKQIAEIMRRDPQGQSVPRRLMAFQELLQERAITYQKSGEFDGAALHAFLAEEQHAKVRFLGWLTLGMRVYRQLGKVPESIAALHKAWADCPEEQRGDVGGQIAWAIVEARAEASAQDRTFALEVARSATEASPDDANLFDTLAQCYDMNGQTAEALAAIERAIALEPDNKNWKLTRQKLERED